MSDEQSSPAKFFGGRATRFEVYAIAVAILVVGFGSVGGAIVVASNSEPSSNTASPAPTETVVAPIDSTTTAPAAPGTQPTTTEVVTPQRTITTDVRGAELPFAVPADRCASTVVIPNVIGMEQWQVASRWPSGFPECGPVIRRLFGYTLDGAKVIGGYECPDGTPLRIESQDPQPGLTFTIAQLVGQGTSTTWGPCPGVTPK